MTAAVSMRSLFGLGVMVAVTVGGSQLVQAWSHERLAQQVVSRARPGDIQMLSSLTCVYCAKAHAWFVEHRVPFGECFIERDPACQSRYDALLAPGTPMLWVRGRRLVGFDEATLAAALAVQ